MRKLTFRMKYKLGIAKEGKDFFTCGYYQFCNNCKTQSKPCHKYLGRQEGIQYLKKGYEDIVTMKNSLNLPQCERINRCLEDLCKWKIKKWTLKKL